MTYFNVVECQTKSYSINSEAKYQASHCQPLQNPNFYPGMTFKYIIHLDKQLMSIFLFL